MGIIVHHQPVNPAALWNLHVWQAAWDGNLVADQAGTRKGNLVDFGLPDVPDPRKLAFQYQSTVAATGAGTWEADDFARRLYQAADEIWTFEASPRVLYQDPYPTGISFQAGDVLTVHVITQSMFRGGEIYAWNPYDADLPTAVFAESGRDEASGISTFRVTLAEWMTAGFHLKLMNGPKWEPDSSNRVWRPCDGSELWLKSGQCDVRSQSLALTTYSLEVLYSAQLAAPPQFALRDEVEQMIFPVTATSAETYTESALFRVATYAVPIYPAASYSVFSQQDVETPALVRP